MLVVRAHAAFPQSDYGVDAAFIFSCSTPICLRGGEGVVRAFETCAAEREL
jgi:hypothetical protein